MKGETFNNLFFSTSRFLVFLVMKRMGPVRFKEFVFRTSKNLVLGYSRSQSLQTLCESSSASIYIAF